MPDWKAEVAKHLDGLGIKPEREAYLVEELAQHLEDRYQESRAEGESEQTAYEAAASELRDTGMLAEVMKTSDRAPRADKVIEGSGIMGNLFADAIADVRYAWRGLVRAPAFAIFAVLTLAIGIGANTTVFTVINTILLHPLPAREPSKLVALYTTPTRRSSPTVTLLPMSYANLKDYAARNGSFTEVAGYTPPMVLAMHTSSGAERLFAQLVTAKYFEVLGLEPAKGRFFAPTEATVPGSSPVAVLSYGAWQARFGGAPDIAGRQLAINDGVFTVVGVAPRGFIGVSAVFGPDVWLPATMAGQVIAAETGDLLRDRGKAMFHGVARLRPGITEKQAEANMVMIAQGLEREDPADNDSRSAAVRPISNELLSSVGGASAIVMGSAVLLFVVGLVLLIACSNVANLLLARASSRRQEFSVRVAMGASRGRVIRQMLTESLLLSLLGGLAGTGVGYLSCTFLWSLRPAEVARNLAEPKLDLTVFALTLFAALVTGLIFGIAPALRTARVDLIEGLREEPRIAGRGRRAVTFSNALLVGQVAFSLIALTTASLMLRSIDRAYQIDPGFDARHLATVMVNPAQAGYDREHSKALFRDIREHLRTLPGIASASWASNMPFWSSATRGIAVAGERQKKQSELLMSVVNTVDLDYFSTMRIPMLAGRAFLAADDAASRPVTIVNETMAHKYWGEGNPIGRRIQLSGDAVSREVVGVVRGSNYTSLGEPPQPCVYLPFAQNYENSMILYARSEGDPSSILHSIQATVQRDAPKVEVSDLRTGDKIVGQVLFGPKIGVALLSVFGLIALVLASVGLYGIMAYSVSRREREIGVRMAMGAQRNTVLRLVLKQGMSLVCVGILVGLGGALLLGRGLTGILYGVSAADPVSLAGASATLIAVALLACYLPARAASRMDPMAALRQG